MGLTNTSKKFNVGAADNVTATLSRSSDYPYENDFKMKVVLLHLIDFVEEHRKCTSEELRLYEITTLISYFKMTDIKFLFLKSI